MKPNKVLHIIGSISRTLLALTFLFSGIVKAIDPLGTVYKIEDYLKAFGGFFTDLMPLAATAAVCLILFECVMGVCLLCNIKTQWTAWLSLVFYAVMLPLTLYIALTNPVSDCGCFGDALVLTNWQTFWKNVVLMALVIMLLVCRRHIPSTFSWWAELTLCLLSAAAALGLMAYTYYHLPLMDFRPYKIGNHIPTLMEDPEDAPQDVYEISFVYAKDGEEHTFTLEDYPKDDPAWTFVRQNSRLVSKGYEPPVHDFEILNADYEDITYDLLESDEKVTLVVMYDVQKSDLSQLPKILSLKRNAEQRDETFCLVTGSGTEAIETFLASDGAEELREAVCTCDPVTLKTIVRANPGVVELKNGTIINKYNLRNK